VVDGITQALASLNVEPFTQFNNMFLGEALEAISLRMKELARR